MQVQQVIDCQMIIRAVLKERGECHVTMTVGVPYANGTRIASRSMDITDPVALEQVKDLLEGIGEAYGKSCATQAMQAAQEAEDIARRRGEL